MHESTETTRSETRGASATIAQSSVATACRILHFDGRDWKVREEPNRLRHGSRDHSLIFESSSLIRRVRCYPPNWFELADDALFRVSLGT